MRFQDRRDAGRRLAERLAREDFVDPVVLALPRGGVPVAAPVAEALGAPLHVFVARKIGAPGHPEFGIGAIAEGRDEVVVSVAAARLGLSEEDLERLAADARAELDRQVTAYRGGAELPPLQSRDVVVIDDGLATGVTAEAALRSLRRNRPRRLTFAAPICAADTAHRLKGLADEVICVSSPRQFYAVGQGYEDFEPTTDEEVLRILRRGTPAPRAATAVEERAVVLDLKGGGQLHADLTLPEQSDGVVLFAHGSGSSRHSPGTASSLPSCSSTAWPPCWPTCSPTRRSGSTSRRNSSGSTSSCWRSGWPRLAHGLPETRRPPTGHWATSARAPARPQP